MGMTLSETGLDGLMKRFDSGSDGTVSFDEFKSMMHKLGEEPEDEENDYFWLGLGRKLKRALTKNGVTRKLDVAFQMSDIERIENMGVCRSNETKMLVDSDLAPLTLAIYLNGVRHPLVVMCSKPAHVEAWVEAFRICFTWQLPTVDWGAGDIQRDGSQLADGALPGNWRCSTIDWGDDDDDDTEEEKDSSVKRERNHVPNLRCSTVDWGS